ncbi:MAG: META domain-containing protein [Bacteroides sp.]|nr:META domain-containing protein [Bacteroides sp.]
MKKLMTIGCLAALCMGVASCASTKNVATLASLDGEWNIIEINGEVVVPAPGQTFPFIAFNAKTGEVYGNAGCNSMTGSINKNAKAGTIDLSALGATSRMCEDMKTEQQVLQALAKVKKYNQLNDENMALTGSSKKDVIVLQKKQPKVNWDDLSGKWMITQAQGKEVPQGMENQPFLEFNLIDNKLHGNAGCNIVNASLIHDEANPSSLKFHSLIHTMMMCPDMEVEDSVIKSLNATASFGALADGAVGLYDTENNLVLVMKK